MSRSTPANPARGTPAPARLTPPSVVRPGNGEGLNRSEWAIGNGLGGFAMGTASGVPSRRYHGWLIGAARPPVARVLALSSMAEWLVLLPGAAGGTSEQRIDLSSYRFSGSTGGVVSPRGIDSLQRFEKHGACVRWEYQFGLIRASREVMPLHGLNATLIRYRVRTGGHAGRLELRPLTALRDFHGPLLDRAAGTERFQVTAKPGGFEVEADGNVLGVTVGGVASGASFKAEPQWWYDFEYVREAERGLEAHEDLFNPGVLSVSLPSFPAVSGDDLEHVVDVVATFWSRTGQGAGRERAMIGKPADLAKAGVERVELIAGAAVAAVAARAGGELSAKDRESVAALAVAGDAFVVGRATAGPAGAEGAESVIAGYPWFSDWGRDTMISLRGLFLETGRAAEAGRVLRTFAKFVKDGLVPNCFDDVTGEPQYHTIDASLWFVHAACDYLRATGDRAGFTGELAAACWSVIEGYRRGTRLGIAVDDDGLVMGGDAGTALTWMDARRDGVVFTARDGKPVEIQALWYNALLSLADATEERDASRARELRQLADKAATSFVARFWDASRGRLADRLERAPGGGWTADWTLRCNQVFAASLPHSPLSPEKRRAVVATVKQTLLTPMGLRTLDRRDPRYLGRYRGPLFERDRAYHNGTVWPWLMGPYVLATLRVGRETGTLREAAAEARAALTPLLGSISAGIAPGSIPEIFDGDVPDLGPQRADGCPAQAWSVAQTLEALAAIIEAERG